MVRLLVFSILLLSNNVFANTDIIVKIGSSTSFEEGDIIHAMNEKRILDVHAQHVVSPKLVTRDKDGRIEAGTLLEFYLEKVKQYKFERIANQQVRRTNLWTSKSDTLSLTPNANGEYIDASIYVKRRLTLKPNTNMIFGNPGQEYWYGGGSRRTDAIMDQVWDHIEANSSHIRNTDFPFTDREKKAFLIMEVNDLTDAEVGAMTAPLLDNDGNIVKARANKIDFAKTSLTAKEITDLQNKTISNDYRNKTAVDINTILK